MITFRVSADVKGDRRVILTLPPEVPTGKNDLIVSIASESEGSAKLPRSSLADWADQHAEHWGNELSASRMLKALRAGEFDCAATPRIARYQFYRGARESG